MAYREKPFIIGLTGRAGAGKDTAGDVLANALGFTRYQFARPIKDALNAMLGFKPGDWWDREWKENPIPKLGYSPRKLAQTLGTEWGRSLDPNFWIKVTESLIMKSGDIKIAITDLRFNNEALWVQANGGYVIEVVRAGKKDGTLSDHVSEAGVDPKLIDFTIVNDTSRDMFERQVSREVKEKLDAERSFRDSQSENSFGPSRL